MRTDLKVKKLTDGEMVPEGLSFLESDSCRVHLKYQKVLPDGKILRVRMAIPKETFLDTDTWTCEEEIYEKQVRDS